MLNKITRSVYYANQRHVKAGQMASVFSSFLHDSITTKKLLRSILNKNPSRFHTPIRAYGAAILRESILRMYVDSHR